jgi:hypothetical protein
MKFKKCKNKKCGKDAYLMGVDDKGYKYYCPHCYKISHYESDKITKIKK